MYASNVGSLAEVGSMYLDGLNRCKLDDDGDTMLRLTMMTRYDKPLFFRGPLQSSSMAA